MASGAGATGPEVHHDPVAARIGMWLFLATEVLLFGALFIVFAMQLTRHRWDFVDGSRHLDVRLGALNTAVLLTSSLTMALAIGALLRSRRTLCILLLLATVVCAGGFLGVKAYEWGHKFETGLFPRGEALLQARPGVQAFFGLYYVMTGLHALHVAVGVVVIVAVATLVGAGRVHAGRAGLLENVGLYWHLVDIVWIFLFPLFYLLGNG